MVSYRNIFELAGLHSDQGTYTDNFYLNNLEMDMIFLHNDLETIFKNHCN